MERVRTEIDIDAAPERVWDVLTDFAGYPAWSPLIDRARVDGRPGGRISFRIHLEAMPALPIVARIHDYEPGRALSWTFGGSRVASVEHYFRIERREGGCRLVHGEDFGGVFGMVMPRGVLARVERSYAAFNRALKARVESRARVEAAATRPS